MNKSYHNALYIHTKGKQNRHTATHFISNNVDVSHTDVYDKLVNMGYQSMLIFDIYIWPWYLHVDKICITLYTYTYIYIDIRIRLNSANYDIISVRYLCDVYFEFYVRFSPQMSLYTYLFHCYVCDFNDVHLCHSSYYCAFVFVRKW